MVLLCIAFLEGRKSVEKLGGQRIALSPLFLYSMQAMQRSTTLFPHHNKGFINHIFCSNWAVRNRAGTRLDFLAW